MAAAEQLIRAAEPAAGRLELDGETLTAKRVREAIRHSKRRVRRRDPESPSARRTTSRPESSSAPGTPRGARSSPGRLEHGFYFSLGHGVGLEVHEAPNLGLAGSETLTDYPYDL